MLVGAAGGLVSGARILALVRAMLADLRAGIIQSPPQRVQQVTPFGRSIQFAGPLHGPPLSTGQRFGRPGEANVPGPNPTSEWPPS